jgi:hypothetical protein
MNVTCNLFVGLADRNCALPIIYGPNSTLTYQGSTSVVQANEWGGSR